MNLKKSYIILPAPNKRRGDSKYYKVDMQVEPTYVWAWDGVVEWKTMRELQNLNFHPSVRGPAKY